METTQKDNNMDDIIKELEKEEQMDSLYYLVQKLPEFTEKIRFAEDKLDFLESVMNDKQSITSLGQEVEEKVGKLHLTQEHLDALVEIIHLLPRLVPMLKKLEEVTLFINDFLSDSKSVEYALKGLDDLVPVSKASDIITETNERFEEEQDSSNVSLFDMYRMLKDPTVQQGFKYVRTLLDVVNKK